MQSKARPIDQTAIAASIQSLKLRVVKSNINTEN